MRNRSAQCERVCTRTYSYSCAARCVHDGCPCARLPCPNATAAVGRTRGVGRGRLHISASSGPAGNRLPAGGQTAYQGGRPELAVLLAAPPSTPGHRLASSRQAEQRRELVWPRRQVGTASVGHRRDQDSHMRSEQPQVRRGVRPASRDTGLASPRQRASQATSRRLAGVAGCHPIHVQSGECNGKQRRRRPGRERTRVDEGRTQEPTEGSRPAARQAQARAGQGRVPGARGTQATGPRGRGAG